MVVGIILMLCQPLAGLADGDAVDTLVACRSLTPRQTVISDPGQVAGIIRARDASPDTAIDRAFPLSPTGPQIHTSTACGIGPENRYPEDFPMEPVQHRGGLALDLSAASGNIRLFARGPDTPPPSSGDWTIDEAGNFVNDTTIMLEGSLIVTTGDLTLDNVTLIMKCMTDGQHEINVNAGGVLNLINCTITAFNGSLHYKFVVHGNMTMDRCDASEMWGDMQNWQESGMALFSSNVIIRSSVVSNGATCGILVFGSAEPQIADTTVHDNPVYGIAVFDTSPAVLENCTASRNNWSGIAVAHSATPVISNCTATNNSMHGLLVSDKAWPRLSNCTSERNERSGIVITGNSTPELAGCLASGNAWNGIQIDGSARPNITACTAQGNNWHGIAVGDNATPTLMNCTARGNNRNGIMLNATSNAVLEGSVAINNSGHGIQVLDLARPALTDCTATGNDWTGMEMGDNATPTLSDCRALNNSIHGFGLSGSSRAILRDCISTGNTVCGIAVGDNSTAELTRCRAANNSANGLQVTESARPVFTQCNSTLNNWSGIACAHLAAARFDNCQATNNSAHGIQVQDAAEPVIGNCTAGGNGWSGIAAGGASRPHVSNCTSTCNNQSGVAVFDRSTAVLSSCTSSGNGLDGLSVLDDARPALDGLTLRENGGKNLWVSSTSPILMANSTLAGGSPQDMQLGNSSRVAIIDTAYTKLALVLDSAQLRVQWYLSFKVLDRSRNPMAGAVVEGAGSNGSRIPPVLSGPDGTANWLVATEYVQNGTGSASELSYCGPYDISVTRDGETNTTGGIPAQRGFSGRLYFDCAPRLGALPDLRVTEDEPTVLDLDPYIIDRDDPLSRLGFWTDRNYAVIDNATRVLTIVYPYNLPGDVLTVTVTDGLRNTSQILNLSVVMVNDRPFCREPFPDLEVEEDRTLVINLSGHFSDEESGTRLTLTCSRAEIIVDNRSRLAHWTPGDGNSSLANVTFSASDGELSGTSNAFNITFIPVNDPPEYLGGLEDASVPEHMNWTIDLDECFWDEEDLSGLIYVMNGTGMVIDPQTHIARWSPSGNTSFGAVFRITAHDPQNYSRMAESGTFTLTYIPMNDPPWYLGTLGNARLKAGEEWNITLEDHFQDDDTEALRFSSNNPAVKIMEVDNTTHYAIWRPGDLGGRIDNLVFTAHDGETHVRSETINLSAERKTEQGLPAMVTNIIERMPWYLYILLPAGIVAGVAAFYGYRRVRYGKYDIEQIFLVYKDGRLIAHRSRKKAGSGAEDVISGMLTALQGFIKESLQDETKGELDEMKYGDLKIAIERGKKVYLAVFLSGYITEKLRSEMRALLGNVDKKFQEVLQSWDGTVDKLAGVRPLLDGLMGGEKEAVKPKAKPAPPAAPAPAPAATKKLLQKVVSQMARAPGEEIILKSELEFYQGFVRLKVAAKNGLDSLISDASFKLVYDPKVLRIDRVEPDYPLRGDEVTLGNIDSKEKKTVAFYLDPQMCTESYLEGVLTYKDVQKGLQSQNLPRKLASVVCPVFYTDENINTAMLRRMCESELDRQDTKVFSLPDSLDPARAFEIGKAAIKHHDVRLVRELSEPEPYNAEAWFYGKVKGREDRLVIRVRVLGDRKVLELFGASSSKLMLTGLLAELKTDLAMEFNLLDIPGEMAQLTDATTVKEVATEKALLDGAPDERPPAEAGGIRPEEEE